MSPSQRRHAAEGVVAAGPCSARQACRYLGLARSSLDRTQQRWAIEQNYQQLKEELGLDHFEGRSWRGLHHHLTLCFLAFCFLTRLRTSKKNLRAA